GLDDAATYPMLIAELLRRGWSEADLSKLTNGNAFRVLRAAETVADRLQAESAPGVGRIP
ncbi:MAG TPA: membrane dipeptidase, partial [Woeseiaceae bacterium]|nr:membrane dipeptidase [Woeseiaceae bacterium]